MKKLRHIITVLVTLLVSFTLVPVVFAHPLGNFTINQYAGLTISRETILLDYVVDMAEIPTFQEITALDTNGNNQPDASESAGYHAYKCAALQPSLNLILNNRRLSFTLTSSSVTFPIGVGGLPTLRLTCEFQTAFDATENIFDLSFINNAFPDRLGWKEIVVIAEGVSLKGDYSSISPSDRLTNYPQGLLSSPLDQRQVEFDITLAVSAAELESVPPPVEATALPTDRNDEFTRLILMEEITLSTLLLALGISFAWGAMHAMTPGHGKTIVGAYLVGSRGTLKHAVYLGLTTTITHTLGVFILGLITLFAAQYIVPEKLYPWMSLLSGLFVVVIGINLFAERFRSSGLAGLILAFKTNFAGAPKYVLSGASNLNQSSRDHKYVLQTSSQDHTHSHGNSHPHSHSHGEHSHDDRDHYHKPPAEITWRNLLALGISGGLIPCPSALVVLLGAIALNKIGFGLILVLAFSLGLAGALTAIGMMFIYAGKLFERFPSRGGIIGILPVISAFLVSLIGLGIVIKAAMELGV
ncbi:MAG: sulfite exporter TauE/SafE family protein [Anaerolineae bacterium]|nr:sulfite exporter TauE/SafE family protein [Anaerolineae bacterium]